MSRERDPPLLQELRLFKLARHSHAHARTHLTIAHHHFASYVIWSLDVCCNQKLDEVNSGGGGRRIRTGETVTGRRDNVCIICEEENEEGKVMGKRITGLDTPYHLHCPSETILHRMRIYSSIHRRWERNFFLLFLLHLLTTATTPPTVDPQRSP